VGPGAFREVAGIPLLCRKGEDLSPVPENGPRARRRQGGTPDVLASLHVAGPQLGQLGGDAYLQIRDGARREVIDMELRCLIEDDLVTREVG